jgi:hypothetical protein
MPSSSAARVLLPPLAEMAARMRVFSASLSVPAALAAAAGDVRTLVCGSLFLAGEALVLLGAYPWDGDVRFDASELLHAD